MTDQMASRVDEISESFRDRTPSDLRQSHSVTWYLDEYVTDPDIGRNAHQRVADMFEHYGTEYDDDDEIVLYKLASEDPLNDGENTFYGRSVHEAIHEFVNKVKGGAHGLGPDKRIKLLTGPVGSGKSDFDRQMRRYFEAYTGSDAGRMYTFRWTNLDVIDDQDPADYTVRSPMNQDPIVLLPVEERQDIIDEANANLERPYTLRNEQRLDPESAFYMEELLDQYDGDLSAVFENHVEVIRLVADENKRQCVETFEPKDKKNQDETELTGDVNYSKLSVYSESDPRAFDYAGAFCNANRGIFSGEELLKLQKEFLYDFLHATQEQTIKPTNNPRIDIDQVIVGRTNMPEYREKSSDETMEAFNDRTKRVDFPYVLQHDAEAKIYQKLIDAADAQSVHIEPHTLQVAGLFAVLTRIDEPDSDTVDIVQKALAYNDPQSEAEIDVEKLRNEAEAEGMDGISPRFVGDEISESIMNEMHEDSTSLSALTVLDHMDENLDLHASVRDDRYDDYYRYIERARDWYREQAIEDVRHALAYDDEEIQKQGEKYFDHVMAYIDDDTVEDSLSGEHVEPDESFMRSVETQLNIPKDQADTFRQEITNWISRRARRGEGFDPADNEKIRTALEKKIWEDKKHNINFQSLVSASDEGRNSEWVEALMERGYSRAGAEEVLDFAGADVAKSEMEES